MGLFKFLGRLGKDVLKGVSAVTDVATGNFQGAFNAVSGISNPFGSSHPALVSPSSNVYPWQNQFGPPNAGMPAPTMSLIKEPTSINSYPSSPVQYLPTATVTTPSTVTATMSQADMINFFQYLANHDWTGTWDMFLQMLQHPFSDWGSNLQRLYQQWISQGGKLGGVPATSQAQLLPGETVGVKTITSHRATKRGYVVVDINGVPTAVKKSEARAYGWKPPHKPPISAKEWREAKAAKKVEKRLKRVAGELDMVAEKRGDRRHRDYRNRHSHGKEVVEEAIIVDEKPRRR